MLNHLKEFSQGQRKIPIFYQKFISDKTAKAEEIMNIVNRHVPSVPAISDYEAVNSDSIRLSHSRSQSPPGTLEESPRRQGRDAVRAESLSSESLNVQVSNPKRKDHIYGARPRARSGDNIKRGNSCKKCEKIFHGGPKDVRRHEAICTWDTGKCTRYES